MSVDSQKVYDINWTSEIIQSIDVGLVIIDWDYKIQSWNRFMENHSGIRPDRIVGKNLFDYIDGVEDEWLKRKTESVFILKNRTYSTWEQHKFIFKFKNYRPITGVADYMYQNITFVPLVSADNIVRQVAMIIYDVTDVAVGRKEIESANALLEILSRTDKLTGLNNRGYWEECLGNEYRRAKRNKQPCSLFMFDIDHFKKVNDTYGHLAGDEVIRVTAAKFLEVVRSTDICGRYGGEEFVVILPDTDAKGAKQIAERLRKVIEAYTVTYEDLMINYTISIGISELNDSIPDYKSWLKRADMALYECKEDGRNRSAVYTENADNSE